MVVWFLVRTCPVGSCCLSFLPKPLSLLASFSQSWKNSQWYVPTSFMKVQQKGRRESLGLVSQKTLRQHTTTVQNVWEQPADHVTCSTSQMHWLDNQYVGSSLGTRTPMSPCKRKDGEQQWDLLLRDKGSKSIKKKTLLALLKGTSFFSVLSWNNLEFEKITLYPESHNLALLKAWQCVTPVIL